MYETILKAYFLNYLFHNLKNLIQNAATSMQYRQISLQLSFLVMSQSKVTLSLISILIVSDEYSIYILSIHIHRLQMSKKYDISAVASILIT